MTTPKHVKQIFLAAADISSPAERQKYVELRCGDDGDLRSSVQELLATLDEPEPFLDSPVLGESTVPTVHTDKSHETIGPYKLLQQIGEGGFGVVYMAEQTTPMTRKVAVKIIKPGMDSSEVIARFEAERQALALMDHANIAKVLDAGKTEEGRPYFVMELVRGEPVTEFADKESLTTEERLRLFATVCRAVQHAHHKGIIHRDLKPSNVLVTMIDGEPVVKVIDFGVAKALHQKLTERTLFTAHGNMIGTPRYMSPEQAAISGVDVDTRSDVYSLGVMLYELLTGTTPLQQQELREAAFAEIQKLVRERESPALSARLSTLGEEITTVAKHRRVEPAQLHKLLRGELNWIVQRALEKERARRYESPGALANDIDRFLGDEPVEASPPSNLYRARKFVRRNRTLVYAASAVGLSLIVGLVATIYGLLKSWEATRIAEAEQAKTQRALERSSRVVKMWSDMLRTSTDGNRTVREMLEEFEPTLPELLKDDPLVEAELLLGLGWLRHGKLWEKREQTLTRAIELMEANGGDKKKLAGMYTLRHRDEDDWRKAIELYVDAGAHGSAARLIRDVSILAASREEKLEQINEGYRLLESTTDSRQIRFGKAWLDLAMAELIYDHFPDRLSEAPALAEASMKSFSQIEEGSLGEKHGMYRFAARASGWTKLLLGRYDDALQDLKAIHLPGYREGVWTRNLGHLDELAPLLQQGRVGEAFARIQEKIETTDPRSSVMLMLRDGIARMQLWVGNEKAALKSIELLLAEETDNPTADLRRPERDELHLNWAKSLYFFGDDKQKAKGTVIFNRIGLIEDPRTPHHHLSNLYVAACLPLSDIADGKVNRSRNYLLNMFENNEPPKYHINNQEALFALFCLDRKQGAAAASRWLERGIEHASGNDAPIVLNEPIPFPALRLAERELANARLEAGNYEGAETVLRDAVRLRLDNHRPDCQTDFANARLARFLIKTLRREEGLEILEVLAEKLRNPPDYLGWLKKRVETTVERAIAERKSSL